MEVLWHVCSVTVMVAAASIIPGSLAFNIDIEDPDIHTGEPDDFFGYKVLPFKSGVSKGIIVTSPLKLNGSGGISRHDQDQSPPEWFSPGENSLPNTTAVKHLGLSIAADSSGSHFTVCSPSVAHECYENSYLNSICYNITERLREISSFTPAFQACTKKTVDLVFLFDGSNSMTTAEFNKNKDFIVDIMDSLTNTSIKFAAVQFSTEVEKVFDFNDYKAGLALQKLKAAPHMRELTNTHKALTFVLRKIFVPAAGASPDATRVLVLITDGDPSDRDRNKIVDEYDAKKLIRFVIGVKEAKLDKFKAIASEPKDQNAFKIEEYDGLTQLLEKFQKKIFTMEGSTVSRAGNMTNEMSQSGFSLAFHEDRLILGSVGTETWRGSLREHRGINEVQIEDPDMESDSYMGYSISVGEKEGLPLYFTGAPRFAHMGRVVFFKHDGKNWTAVQRINGEQIGSYFGSELCSLDVNSDGNTDFLLVGAPLFYRAQEKQEGLIYIYTLTDQMLLKAEVNVNAPSMGRFGTTITSLADLNGDGLRDVAVGAPLEDNNRGAVYIYLGDAQRAVRSTHCQRITGEAVDPGIRFFGQAINGDIDLGEDGLVDVVVGSRGAAVVLRSKPVFNITARLSFHPEEISTEKLECKGTEQNLPMVDLRLCFEMVEVTSSNAVLSGLNITYTIDVDSMQLKNRGFFLQSGKKNRLLTNTYELMDKETCFNHSIHMPECVIDTVSPVGLSMNFSQVDAESAPGVLNVDSVRHAGVEVLFERDCENKDACVADLAVDFRFMTPTLIVTEGGSFNVSVTLANRGDGLYNTSLTMLYPEGLSYSVMTLKEATRPTLHSCNNLKGGLNKTTCGISLPVYRSRSSATFKSSFLIVRDYDWSDTISMTFAGDSDNLNSTVALTKSIPVQFEITMAVTVEKDTVTYLNFTSADTAPKEMLIIYRVINTGFKDFPVNVSLFFPTKLEHNFEMKSFDVFIQHNKTQCRKTPHLKTEFCPPGNGCVTIECDEFNLERYSAVEFKLAGDVHFKDPKQHAANIGFLKRYTGDSAEVRFKSFIDVDYDKHRYWLGSHEEENREKSEKPGYWRDNDPTIKDSEVRVEFIVPPDQLLIILTGAGLGLLLLIIITVVMFKLGCFKRKTYEYYEEREEAATLQAGTSLTSINGMANASKTDGKSEQPPEEKSLLEAKENSLDTAKELD